MACRSEEVFFEAVPGKERIKYEVFIDDETGLDIDPVSGLMRSRDETLQYLKEVYKVGAAGPLKEDLERYNKWIQAPGNKEKERSLFAAGGDKGKKIPSSTPMSAPQPPSERRRLEAAAKKDMGNEALGQRNYRLALRRYSDGIALDKSSVPLWANRSEANLRLRRFKEALRDAEEALKLDPQHEKAMFRRAHSLVGLGRIPEALSTFQQGSEKFPGNATAWVQGKKSLEHIPSAEFLTATIDRRATLVAKRVIEEGEAFSVVVPFVCQWAPRVNDDDVFVASRAGINPLTLLALSHFHFAWGDKYRYGYRLHSQPPSTRSTPMLDKSPKVAEEETECLELLDSVCKEFSSNLKCGPTIELSRPQRWQLQCDFVAGRKPRIHSFPTLQQDTLAEMEKQDAKDEQLFLLLLQMCEDGAVVPLPKEQKAPDTTTPLTDENRVLTNYPLNFSPHFMLLYPPLPSQDDQSEATAGSSSGCPNPGVKLEDISLEETNAGTTETNDNDSGDSNGSFRGSKNGKTILRLKALRPLALGEPIHWDVARPTPVRIHRESVMSDELPWYGH